MTEFPVIFGLAVAGSLVRMAVGMSLRFVAAKTHGETIVAGSGQDWAALEGDSIDPVLRMGLILACDGAIVLALVSAFPGALGLERTGFAFGLLCAGGLIGEIARTGLGTGMPVGRDEEVSAARRPVPRWLSVALTLTLNVAVAVLCTRQGLIDIVPPRASTQATHAPALDPVIVVARRTVDPLDEYGSPY